MRISDWSSDVCSSDLSKDHGIRYDLVGVELHFLDKGIDFGASSNLIVVPWVGRGVSVGRRAEVERILDLAGFGIGHERDLTYIPFFHDLVDDDVQMGRTQCV